MTRRTYPLNSIITGDCRVLAADLPDESVDITFTSPPYNVGLDYGTWDDRMKDAEFWEFQRQWVADAYRLTADPGRMYAILHEAMLWRFRDLAEGIGWRFHQMLVWCKPNMASPGRVNRDWNTMTEWALLFHKGKRTPMINETPNVNTHNWIVEATPQSNFNGNKRKQHAAQMAVNVAFAWLARTPGQVVYDPFMGSGTTAIAARMLGKQYVGFEIDPESADLARHRAAQAQPALLPELAVQLPMGIP